MAHGEEGPARAVVLGDLVLDVVLLPSRPLRAGTDVAGRVALRQGGSAATTARALADEGLPSTLVTALGGDAAGSSLAAYLRTCGVEVHAVTMGSGRAGRLGVLVEPSGERTFVADRGPILRLQPRQLRASWFRRAALLHLPAYSLLGDRLAATASRAAALARAQGARISIDLASAGFLEDFGADAVLDTVRGIGPDLLLANDMERASIRVGKEAGRDGQGRDAWWSGLLDLAPIAVLKEGSKGARARARGVAREIVVAARAAELSDSTGAGDAFDAGLLAAWLRAGAPLSGPALARVLERGMQAGHRAARREVLGRRVEFGIAELRRQA